MSNYNSKLTTGMKFSKSTHSIKGNPNNDEVEIYTLDDDIDLHYEGNCYNTLDKDITEIISNLHLPEVLDIDPTKPFSSFRDKMTDINGDGKLFKQIFKVGCGKKVPPVCTLYIHYSAYYDGNEEPYDVSSLRSKKPVKINITENKIYSDAVVGVELGLRTMTMGEICYLLVDPSLGYGKFGCAPRIPKDSWLLYKVELVSIAEYYGKESYASKTFEEILESSAKKCSEGTALFFCNNLRGAIEIFNSTFRMLLNMPVKNYEQNDLRNESLIKLGKNLAVCYNKRDFYKKVCCVYNDVYSVAPKHVEKDIKLLFLRGKALGQLGNYKLALMSLNSAAKLEPNNKKVIEEIEKVQKKQKQSMIFETNLVRALIDDDVQADAHTAYPEIAEKKEQLERFIKLELRRLVHSDDTELKLPLEDIHQLGLYQKLCAEFRLNVRKQGKILIIYK